MSNTISTRTPVPRPPKKLAVLGTETGWNLVLASEAVVGDYDVVMLDTFEHGYTRIRGFAPDLIVAAVDLDDPQGCIVLSMLKADRTTCDIPVVLCVPPAPPTSDEPLDQAICQSVH
jgi:CheY-like chemotaxis protein